MAEEQKPGDVITLNTGAWTKRTNETRVRLLRAFEQGATVEVACDYAGISVTAFGKWCNDDGSLQPEVKRARSTSAVQNLSLVRRSAMGILQCSACGTPNEFPSDARMAVEWLRLVYPKHYGRNADVHVEVDVKNSFLRSAEFDNAARIIMEALEPFPDAKGAVSAALLRAGAQETVDAESREVEE